MPVEPSANSSLDRIPLEIWWHILSCLFRREIKEFSLVQRRLRSISRPFIFQHFVFYPFVPGSDTLPDETREKLLERLNFWASPEICLLVRSCTVVGTRAYSQGLGIKAAPLLEVFITSLPHFINLQDLCVAKYVYDRNLLDALCRLPNLDHLACSECVPKSGERASEWSLLPLLGISGFKIRPGTDEYAPVHWIDLLRRNKLNALSVPCERDFCAAFRTGGPFSLVKKLEVQLSGPTSLELFCGLLSTFPATEFLKIHRGILRDFIDCNGGFSCLTALKDYSGPHFILPYILPISAPWPKLQIDPCEPSAFMTRLNALNTNHMTTLRITFSTFNHQNLKDLCVSCPGLTYLLIDVYALDRPWAWSIREFFDNLVQDPQLPPNIEKFALHWDFFDDSPTTKNVFPDGPALKAALTSIYTEMRELWVGDYSWYLFYWRRGERETEQIRLQREDSDEDIDDGMEKDDQNVKDLNEKEEYWDDDLWNTLELSWKNL